MTQGIYKIENRQNKKAYIGSSLNIERRWGKHRYTLRNGKHRNIHLQRAWDKYGEAAFAFSTLEEVETDMLLLAEQKYLDDYFDQGDCYNIAITAGPAGPKSEEHKRKISKANMGHPVSDKTRRAVGAANRERMVSDETKEKIRRAQTGHAVSDKTRRKMSEASRGNQYALGCKRSNETKRKMRAAQKRRRTRERGMSTTLPVLIPNPSRPMLLWGGYRC